MLRQDGVIAKGTAGKKGPAEQLHLAFQAGRKDGEAHDFDEADVFFLDVVELRVRVVDAEGMLLCCDVVAQDQVEFPDISVPAGDRGDRVVRHAHDGRCLGARSGAGPLRLLLRLGEDESVRIGIAAPGSQDVVREGDDAGAVGAVQAYAGHGPLDDAALHVLEAGDGEGALDGRLLHREGVAAALEVVVCEDRAAYDRQVRIGAQEVVRELLDEVEELHEGVVIDRHRHVLPVEDDAVLVVIDVRRVLEAPLAAVDGDGDDAVVLAGRMVETAVVALILAAELAFGVAALFLRAGGGDGFRILLRLGEVDGHVELAVFGRRLPLAVAGDAVAANIIGIPRKSIVPVRRFLRIFCIDGAEGPDHVARAGRKRPHQAGIIEVPGHHAPAVQQTAGGSIVEQRTEDLFQRETGGKFLLRERLRARLDVHLTPLPGVQLQDPQQTVDTVENIFLLDQSGPQRITGQFCDSCLYITHRS